MKTYLFIGDITLWDETGPVDPCFRTGKSVLTKPCIVLPAPGRLDDLPDLVVVCHRARLRPDGKHVRNFSAVAGVYLYWRCMMLYDVV